MRRSREVSRPGRRRRGGGRKSRDVIKGGVGEKRAEADVEVFERGMVCEDFEEDIVGHSRQCRDGKKLEARS